MQTLKRLYAWLNSHREIGFDLIRVYLGIGLLIRGILFTSNQEILLQWSYNTEGLDFVGAAMIHFVAMTHLVGGILIAVGLITRIAALFQIPILGGALFFIHLQGGLLQKDQSLEFSALVLFILLVLTFFGAGRYSLDSYISGEK